MKLIKNWEKFNEGFSNSNIEKSINLITSYIERKSGVDLNPYDEIFSIQKDDKFLSGQLFLSVKSDKAIRINWIKGDLRSEIDSIDIWISFKFDTNPDYTIDLNGESVTKSISQISNIFNNPSKYISIKEPEMELTENYDPEEELKDLDYKLRRARSDKSKELISRKIENIKLSISKIEKCEKESDKIVQSDLKIDVFKAIELYTIQVARGKSNSLIITGQAGVGKTSVVTETLRSIGMVPDVHYYKSTGTVTTAALYEILFKQRNNLVIFDDCDSVFKEADSINILKGALDTYESREISKHTKGNTFDSTGLSDEEIQMKWSDSGEKLLPNRFEFRGQIIFISNLPEEKFDNALLSRSLHVDVHLNKQEIISRMKDIMRNISPSVPKIEKEEALEYLIHITNNYQVKFDLNIRTLIHSINLRSGNDETINFSGVEEPVWKLLIKKYLVKTK